MIGFLFKKVFFDIWDNLLMLVLMSLGIIVPLALLYLGSVLLDYSMAASLAVSAFALLIFSFYALYL
ncbi:MAG: hypothetical protein IKS77_02235, partial [Spirochaetales bacterium]|nr:hypothetical protein [Spirochaetales bacterium]